MRKIQQIYEEKVELIHRQDELKKELAKMESAKNDYIDCNDHYGFYYGVEVVIICVLVISIIIAMYLAVNGKQIIIPIIVAVVFILILGYRVLTWKSLYVLDGEAMHDELIMKVEKAWVEKNPDYKTKKSLYAEISAKIKELDVAIKGSKILY